MIHGVKVFTPLMLAQNVECHIVNTASMAGLTVGDALAPYSVTKHAVVALSESLHLSLQRRDALVKVSVLCPGMVQTNIMDAERNRPAGLENEPIPMTPHRQAMLGLMMSVVAAGMPPLEVAESVFAAIQNDRFYILPHPEWMEAVQMRTDDLLRMENPRSPAQPLASG